MAYIDPVNTDNLITAITEELPLWDISEKTEYLYSLDLDYKVKGKDKDKGKGHTHNDNKDDITHQPLQDTTNQTATRPTREDIAITDLSTEDHTFFASALTITDICEQDNTITDEVICNNYTNMRDIDTGFVSDNQEASSSSQPPLFDSFQSIAWITDKAVYDGAIEMEAMETPTKENIPQSKPPYCHIEDGKRQWVIARIHHEQFDNIVESFV